ncbi:MAG: hypothetical protein ACI9GB_002324, partial [Halioglobus sp.]
ATTDNRFARSIYSTNIPRYTELLLEATAFAKAN